MISLCLGFSPKTSPLPHTCYMPRPSQFSCFEHPNYIWYRKQMTNLSITQSSPLPSYHVCLSPKYFPQHPVFEHPQPVFLPQYKRPSYKTTSEINILCFLILIFLNSKLKAKGSAPNENKVYPSTM